MNPVRPIIWETLAGGELLSLRPHTNKADGTPTDAYHKYLPPRTLLVAVEEEDDVTPALPPPLLSPLACCNTCVARSLRAARRATRSCFETGWILIAVVVVASESHRWPRRRAFGSVGVFIGDDDDANLGPRLLASQRDDWVRDIVVRLGCY